MLVENTETSPVATPYLSVLLPSDYSNNKAYLNQNIVDTGIIPAFVEHIQTQHSIEFDFVSFVVVNDPDFMARIPDTASELQGQDTAVDDGQTRLHSSPEAPRGSIDYLSRRDQLTLPLLQADAETFADLLSLLSKYEGVLDRGESLASNLGAKLTGPRLLRGLDKFFEGPITVSWQSQHSKPLCWSDVVFQAKISPKDFELRASEDGSRRVCRFHCKGNQAEIGEDDWRLISSGAFDGMSLEQSFEEDELSELTTLDIVEQRASALSTRADEIARRARMLYQQVSQRKSEMCRKREDQGTPFNSRYTGRLSNYVTSYDLRTELLQQFAAASACSSQSQSTSGLCQPSTPGEHNSPSSPYPRFRQAPPIAKLSSMDKSDVTGTLVARDRGDALRSLITQKTDKLLKGDTIDPPCDRCRRLRCPCMKHLTACQGCTKKHAKCSWRSVTTDELDSLRKEMGMSPVHTEGELALEPRLPIWSGPPRVFHFTSGGAPSSAQLDDATRPGFRDSCDIDVESGLPLGRVSHSALELAPIQPQAGIVKAAHAKLPRLSGPEHGHIGNAGPASTSALREEHLQMEGMQG